MAARRDVLATVAAGLALRWAGPAGATDAARTEVAFGGLAYAGNADTLEVRFPLSRHYEQARTQAGRPVYRQLLEDAAAASGAIRYTDGIDSLQGRDRVLAVALVIGSELSSVEAIGPLWKLLTVVRAQVLFFDFKSMTVVRAYPVSFGNPVVLAHPPGPADQAAGIVRVFEGAEGRPGLLARFAQALKTATLPTQSTRLLQVTQATLDPSTLDPLPAALKAQPDTAASWLADIVGEAISVGARVPIVPFAKGYAIGNVLSMRVADGQVFQLRLPQPDYEIQAHLARFRRVNGGQSAAGTALIYGSYVQVKLIEPLLDKVYLDAEFKNGAVKRVPATQAVVDDFPAYYDSLNGLFVKLAHAIDGREQQWIQSAATAPDIGRQLAATRELMNLCR